MIFLVLLVTLAMASVSSIASDALPQVPSRAAVASAHPLATQAGIDILKRGGNAFDAAVAVSATLGVVEPYSSGLGGGGFYLLHRAEDNTQILIDARETAPLAAHRDMYLDARGAVVANASIDGPLAAGIPGIPAALQHLAKRYGKLPLRETLRPAIEAARNGFKVDAHYQRMARFRLAALRSSPAAAKIFLHDNAVPELGHVVVQLDLAKTLSRMAEHGSTDFYHGSTAKRLVHASRAAGGIWTEQDLQRYQIVEREPVRGTYRGYAVTSAGPPSSGGVILIEMLNVLAGFELESLPRWQRIHVIVEAMRRAYRDRAEYLGDPGFVDMPIEQLLHPFYAAGLAAGINLDQATPSGALSKAVGADNQSPHTTHFSILDTTGNRVSATLTINYPFGSGFVAGDTGVLLNDEMDDFSAKPGVPNAYGLIGNEANAIAPGKRPLSSMTPTFVESDDRLLIVGTPGGSRIISMVLLAVLDYVDGANAEQIVSAPRYHHQYLPDFIQSEPDALGEEQKAELSLSGHNIQVLDHRWGNMQAVVWDKHTNQVTAASDPRGVGAAELH